MPHRHARVQAIITAPLISIVALRISRPINMLVFAPGTKEYVHFPILAKAMNLSDEDLYSKVFDSNGRIHAGEEHAWGRLAQLMQKTIVLLVAPDVIQRIITLVAFPDGRTENYNPAKHKTLIEAFQVEQKSS